MPFGRVALASEQFRRERRLSVAPTEENRPGVHPPTSGLLSRKRCSRGSGGNAGGAASRLSRRSKTFERIIHDNKFTISLNSSRKTRSSRNASNSWS